MFENKFNLFSAPDSEPKYVEGQLWNNVTNESNLALRFDETHNGTQLYCSQIIVMEHMQMDGTYRRDWVGEKGKSKEITLLQKPIEDKGSREDRGTDTSEEIKKPEENENYVTDDSNTENENDMKEAGE